VDVAYDHRTGATAVPNSIFWLLAIWVIVVLFALVWGVSNAETSLRDDARERLAAEGYSVAVDFSGRDARLIGSLTDQSLADEVEQAIDSIPGVRLVNNEIAVSESEEPPLRRPEVTFRVVGDAVSISGLVSDEETETKLLEAIEEQFGAGNVLDALVAAEDVEPMSWQGRIEDVFGPLRELRSGGFTADESGMFVSGEVISSTVGAEMIDAVELALGDQLAVTSDLSVAILPPPTFSASGGGGAVVLDGVLPSREIVDRVNAAAERLHDESVIVNVMQVGDVAGPMWLDSIEGLLDVTDRLDLWTMEIADETLTITGMGKDQDTVAALDVLIDGVVGDQLAVVTSVEVDPTAVAAELTELLRGNTSFEPGGIELSAEGVALLDSAIEILAANPSAVLVVEGHTDSQGDAASNLELSQQRAEAVVAYLIAGGIDADRLSAVGYGQERPIADNSSEEGRARNRRIEFVIREGDG
jgi:OOP family OmpA-OmpF porin